MGSTATFIRVINQLAVLLLLAFTSTALAADTSKLFEKAVKEGQVPVIVGLKLPDPGFRPEGTLSPEEFKRQREAIAATRKKLLDSLASYKVVVYAVYESLPYVAMKVDAVALEQLGKSPLVTTIQEDSPEKPQTTGGSG